MKLEVDMLEDSVQAQVFGLQKYIILGCGLAVQMVVLRGGGLAHHHFVQLGLVGVPGVQAAHAGAVLIDIDAVGDLQNLVEVVGDKDDRMALGRDLAHLLVEVFHLSLVEHGSGLVQQDQTVFAAGLLGDVHNLGDLHHLAGGKVQIADLFGGADVGDVHRGQNLGGRPVHLGPVDDAGLPEVLFMAKENVLGHVQGNNQGLLLKDHAHARLVGVHGGLGFIGGAVEAHGTRGLGLGADNDLQQGGLARAVLAHQTHDLAGVDLKLHSLQGLGAAKGLGDVLGAEEDLRSNPAAVLGHGLRHCGGAVLAFQFTHSARPLIC